MTPPSKNQRIADAFDQKLFNLIEEAKQQSEEGPNPSIRSRWHNIRTKLWVARMDVRAMMHPKKRGETL